MANRDGKGGFKKGRSGNPGGRPKKDERLRHIEDLAREHSEEAIMALVDEAKSGKGAPRVAAAVAILDRGWGKPVERKEEGKLGEYDGMSVAELEAHIRERMVRLGLAKVVAIRPAGDSAAGAPSAVR